MLNRNTISRSYDINTTRTHTILHELTTFPTPSAPLHALHTLLTTTQRPTHHAHYTRFIPSHVAPLYLLQDPHLFSGTIRFNLDPFDEFDDAQLWSCLESVQLKGFISEHPSKLSMSVEEGGTDMSHGQRQLLCIARAMLHRRPISVIDEATASIGA